MNFYSNIIQPFLAGNLSADDFEIHSESKHEYIFGDWSVFISNEERDIQKAYVSEFVHDDGVFVFRFDIEGKDLERLQSKFLDECYGIYDWADTDEHIFNEYRRNDNPLRYLRIS